jgi:DHA2 family multidrug resistance protein
MVDNGQKNGWFDSIYITKLGIIALIGFLIFVWWELRTEEPLLYLRILKNRNYTLGTIILTVTFGITYGTIAILPQFLQSLMGYTSYLSGLAAGPMGLGSLIGAAFSGIIGKFLDIRHQIILGLITIAIGCFMFSSLNLNIAYANIVLPNIVLGIGMTIVIVTATTVIFSTVSKEAMTNASSLQNLIKNVGCAVGTSSVGVFVSRFAQTHQSYLIDKLTMLNNVFAERIDLLTTQFMQMGADISTASNLAHGMIYKQLMVQTNLCAFMTSYRTYMIIIVCIIPLVFLLQKTDT